MISKLYPSYIPQSSKLLQLNPMLVHNLKQSLDRCVAAVAAVAAGGVRGFRRGGRSWTRGEGHEIGAGMSHGGFFFWIYTL